MDDTVYRQAAIEAINSHFGFNVEEEYGSAVQEAINGLPSAQPDPRWIPVEEHLPKPNEKEEDQVQKYYLIQNEFGDMMVAAYHGNTSGYTWWEQMYAYEPITDKVIAWMPLPRPYKRSDNV